MTNGKLTIFGRSLAASLAACALGAAFSVLSPALSWTTSQAFARGPFDGTWSVLIVTDSGSCDRAYRYALRIADGRVFYDDPSFSVSGHVDARGNVSVGVNAGSQTANGIGRLSGDYGDGRWSGSSSGEACSGHWEAQRRG